MPKRKPNFFDRKRFVDYEQNQDSDNEKSKEQLSTNKPVAKAMVQEEQFNMQMSDHQEEEEVAVVVNKKKPT